MSLSPKFIQGKLIFKIAELAKGSIWEYPSGQPAVFESKAFTGKTPPSPKMPYIAVDILPTLVPFNDLKYEGWVDGAEFGSTEEVYVTLQSKVMQFSVTVYGSEDDDTSQIASDISLKLKSSYHRQYFLQYEVGLYSISNPVTSDLRLTDQYRDATTFTISLSYTDRVIDEIGGGSITSVNIDTDLHKDPDGLGGLYRGLGDDNPIPIQTGDIPENNN